MDGNLERLRQQLDDLAESAKEASGAFDENFQDLLTALGKLQQRVDSTLERMPEIHGEAESTIVECGSVVDALATGCETAMNGLDERIGQVMERLTEATEELGAEADETLALVDETLATMEGAVNDMLRETGDRMAAAIQDEFAATVEAVGEAFTGALDDAGDLCAQGLEDIAGSLMRSSATVADELIEHARDGLTGVIEGAGQRFAREAVDVAERALVDSLFTAQVAVGLQPMLAPLTPQLMALKPAVPAIRSAMDALQMS